VDSGDPTEKPSDSKAPFMVTPPMSRVDPGKGQTFRLMYTGSPLPTDRESVFWFNVLEVPPRPKAKGGEDNNYLQFAIRTRIKIFFRPKGLAGNPLSAIEQLTWRVTKDGKGFIAECTNNSPFNVSFSDVSFKSAPEAKDIAKGGMCPALGKTTFALRGNPDASQGKLSLTAINDFGGFEPREANFTR